LHFILEHLKDGEEGWPTDKIQELFKKHNTLAGDFIAVSRSKAPSISDESDDPRAVHLTWGI
jgi:hypothetical protein